MAHTDAVSHDHGVLSRAPSPALVVGAIASVQFGSAIGATLFQRVGPGGSVTLRLAFGTVVLAALWRPQIRGHSPGELALAATFGLLLAAMNLCFYEAINRIPLGVAVTIEFVGPLGVAVAGSRRKLDFAWVVLAAAGILALTNGAAHGLDALGVVLALAAGTMWAVYILLNPRLGRAFPGTSGLTLGMCVGSLAILPVGVAAGGSHLLEPRSLALGAAVGVLSSAIPYSFEIEAMRRIPPAVFGVLMSLEPAMAALAGLIVLGQGLGFRALLGIALVVAASVGASRRATKAPVAI
jgi:inner membrane transporter RhtA